MPALKSLLVPVDLSIICFVLAVTKETIPDWLRGSAQRAAEIIEHVLRELPVTQVQLEEMWNLIKRKQPGKVTL